MSGSCPVGGGCDGPEGGHEVAASDLDAGGVDHQALAGLIDLGVLAPQGMQRCLRAQGL